SGSSSPSPSSPSPDPGGTAVTRSLFDITGRLALVTGSSRGLGLALAEGLAQHGARVVLHGRDPQALARAREQVAAAGDGQVPTVSFDVTDAAAVRDGVASLVAEHGVPDILVNNAGIQRRAPCNEFDPADRKSVAVGEARPPRATTPA